MRVPQLSSHRIREIIWLNGAVAVKTYAKMVNSFRNSSKESSVRAVFICFTATSMPLHFALYLLKFWWAL